MANISNDGKTSIFGPQKKTKQPKKLKPGQTPGEVTKPEAPLDEQANKQNEWLRWDNPAIWRELW